MFLQHVSNATSVDYRKGCTFLKPFGSKIASRHHSPLSKRIVNYGSIVSIFRDPRSRIISAFDDYMHHEGMSKETFKYMQSFMNFEELNCIENYKIYSSFPANYGCYTKMINGYKCHQEINITTNMIKFAKNTLENFLFVGIMEEYKLSVRLFLKLINKKRNFISTLSVKYPPHPVEISYTRKNQNYCTKVITQAYKDNKLPPYYDPYDSIIYHKALKIFESYKIKYSSGIILSKDDPTFIPSKLHKPSYIDCPLRWLHPPRTGSTFCLSVQHACNETLFLEQANQHTNVILSNSRCSTLVPNGTGFGDLMGLPLFPEMFPDVSNVITILRKPQSRIISAFIDNIHTEGMSKKSIQDMNITTNYSTSSCLYNYKIYSSYPANYGCYTKMINGFGCHKYINITTTMIENAINKLHEFLFVGIMEEYELSVRLFLKVVNNYNTKNHFNLNVNHSPHPVELMSYNSGLTKNTTECYNMISHAYKTKELKHYHDPYDSIIYKEALKIFHQSKKIYFSTNN